MTLVAAHASTQISLAVGARQRHFPSPSRQANESARLGRRQHAQETVLTTASRDRAVASRSTFPITW